MGSPKKPRKKYSTPTHPWQKERIEEENQLVVEYGLVNKKEIYKMRSMVKNFADQAKKLIASTTEQVEKEKKLLLDKLFRMGLLRKDSILEDILDLDVRDILNRRLQTFVFKKGLARSIKQARQFIVHGHIAVSGKKVTSPSYIVRVNEEDSIDFIPTSSLANPDHPERNIVKAENKQEPKQVQDKQKAQDKQEQKQEKDEQEHKQAENKEDKEEKEKKEENNKGDNKEEKEKKEMVKPLKNEK